MATICSWDSRLLEVSRKMMNYLFDVNAVSASERESRWGGKFFEREFNTWRWESNIKNLWSFVIVELMLELRYLCNELECIYIFYANKTGRCFPWKQGGLKLAPWSVGRLRDEGNELCKERQIRFHSVLTYAISPHGRWFAFELC